MHDLHEQLFYLREHVCLKRLRKLNALEECEGLTTRSSGVPDMKDICFTCQKQGGKIHRVEFKTTGQNMLQVFKMLTDSKMLNHFLGD